MSPSDWGPPTWIFLHTIAEKVKETSFPLISQQLIQMIVEICNNLPCPECSSHAKVFWNNVNKINIQTKQDLINLLFVFHNNVNKRKNTPQFKYENLVKYKNLINESFHRKLMMISLKRWLMKNISHFDVL
jgi:hypothetical protein